MHHQITRCGKVAALLLLFTLPLTPIARAAGGGKHTPGNKSYVSPVTLLHDNDILKVNPNGSYTENETVRLRINDASAIRRYGESHLVYTKGRETIKVLSAYTLTPDGKRIKVPDNKIYNQQLPMSSKAPMFGDIKVKAIVFPSVQVGSILCYHYRRIVAKPLFAGEFTAFEKLPKTFTIKQSRFDLTAPNTMSMHIQTRGPIRGGRVKSGKAGTRHWVWTVHNLSATPKEPGSVAPSQISPFIAISTFASYRAVARAYAVKADKAAAVTPKVQKLADKITKGIRNPRGQAKALYNWVSKNIRYVAIYFGLGSVVPHKADEIIDNGYGDCKDHATLLQALMAAKGIRCSQVLINARRFYALTRTALSTDIFDHCINYLPRYHMFLDSTLGQAPFGLLAPQEYGKPVLVINDGNGKARVMRIPASTPQQDQECSITDATLNANGNVTGKVSYQDTGMFLVVDRKILSTLPDGMQSQVAGRLISQLGVQGTGKIDYNDPDDLALPLDFKASFSLPDYVDYPGSGTFQPPVGVPDLNGMSLRLAHAISLPSRSMPFICPAYRRIQIIHLTVPKGFKGKLPGPVSFHNALGSYRASYRQQGRIITVRRTLTLVSKGMVRQADRYPQLRALYSKAIKDLRQQIVYQ